MDICKKGGGQERMLLPLILISMNLVAVSARGQDCPETPKWFSEGKNVIEKDPSEVALSYLRLMEESALKAAFDLLTPDFADASDPQAFEDRYAKRKDWHTYADTACKTVPVENGKQEVIVKAFVSNEGYFTLDLITFELVKDHERWRIAGEDWKTAITDVSVPIQDARFNMEAARQDATAQSESYSKQLQSLAWLKTDDTVVAGTVPPWLGRLPDDKPFEAVQGYILAISDGNCCRALYYRTDPAVALTNSSHAKAPEVRIYFDSSADHEIDIREDGTATVWSKVWFSKGDTIVIQSVAFECRRVDTVWKIQALIGGPKSYIAAGDFGDVCEVANKGKSGEAPESGQDVENTP